MKKDLKTLNKSVAIAIAAAMTATSAPTPLLMQRHLARSDMLHLMRRIRMFLPGMQTRRQMNTRSV